MEASLTRNVLEACLLVAGKPMSITQLDALFEADIDRPDKKEIRATLVELAEQYADRGIELVEVAGGWRLQTRSSMEHWVGRLFAERPPRYSRALLETLVLIAYRQPITRGEIEEVRGVAVSSSIVRTLQEREWVREVGHKDVPGKPALLGTTNEFLDYFNLKRLDDLPALGELKDVDGMDAVLAAEFGIVEEAGGDAANDGESAGGEDAANEGEAADPESANSDGKAAEPEGTVSDGEATGSEIAVTVGEGAGSEVAFADAEVAAGEVSAAVADGPPATPDARLAATEDIAAETGELAGVDVEREDIAQDAGMSDVDAMKVVDLSLGAIAERFAERAGDSDLADVESDNAEAETAASQNVDPDYAEPDNTETDTLESDSAEQNGAEQDGAEQDGAEQDGAEQDGAEPEAHAPSTDETESVAPGSAQGRLLRDVADFADEHRREVEARDAFERKVFSRSAVENSTDGNPVEGSSDDQPEPDDGIP